MSSLKESDFNKIVSLYMAKRNIKEVIKADLEEANLEYFGLGNNIFLKQASDTLTFYLLELPISDEKGIKTPMISVIPNEAKIKFYVPDYSNNHMVIGEAIWDSLEKEWYLVNRISHKINSSLEDIFTDFERSDSNYDESNQEYTASLKRIIEAAYKLENTYEESKGLTKNLTKIYKLKK